MRIQYCSDLHLEMNPAVEYTTLLTPVAPVLALLGDIGDPESPELGKFLEWCTRIWKQVLYVPGNHEFWRLKPGSKKTIPSTLAILRSYEKLYPNLMIMWRGKVYSEDGIIVLGTPLWSRPAEGVIPHEQERAWVDNDRTFDAQTLSTLHQEDLNWIKQELNAARGTMVVMLTHYAPSLLLINRNWIERPESTLYASDLDILIRPPIVAWRVGIFISQLNGSKDGNRLQEKQALFYSLQIHAAIRGMYLDIVQMQFYELILARLAEGWANLFLKRRIKALNRLFKVSRWKKGNITPLFNMTMCLLPIHSLSCD